MRSKLFTFGDNSATFFCFDHHFLLLGSSLKRASRSVPPKLMYPLALASPILGTQSGSS